MIAGGIGEAESLHKKGSRSAERLDKGSESDWDDYLVLVLTTFREPNVKDPIRHSGRDTFRFNLPAERERKSKSPIATLKAKKAERLPGRTTWIQSFFAALNPKNLTTEAQFYLIRANPREFDPDQDLVFLLP